MKHFRNDI